MKTIKRISIGRLAGHSGVSTATLRYYEKLGLIQSQHRTARGTRYFAPEAKGTLRAIVRFQRMGFTLREMLTLLRLPSRHAAHQARFGSLLKAKLGQLRIEMAAMRKKKLILKRALKRCSTRSIACTCDLGSLLGRGNT